MMLLKTKMDYKISTTGSGSPKRPIPPIINSEDFTNTTYTDTATTNGNYSYTTDQPTSNMLPHTTHGQHPTNPTITDPTQLSTGAIAGIAIGASLVLVAVIGVVGYFCWKKRSSAELEIEEKPVAKPTISAPQSAIDMDGYLVPMDQSKTRISRAYENGYVLPDTNIYCEISETKEPPPKEENLYDTPESLAAPGHGDYIDFGR